MLALRQKKATLAYGRKGILRQMHGQDDLLNMKIGYRNETCPWCKKNYNGYDHTHQIICYDKYCKDQAAKKARQTILGNITIQPIKRLIDLIKEE